MHPRDRLIDLFSTFAQLEDDRFRHWIGDPRLQRSMQRQLTHNSQNTTEEKIWAIYWYRQRESHPLAPSHLTAYLQEPCFWVAREMTQRLQNSQYTLADYFQIANIEIPKVWKSFASDRGSNLKSYAKLVLTNALKDLLRQRQAADVCSNWSLLRKVSKKRIGEVLLQRGITEPEASQYQLAWFCFKTLYLPPDSQGAKLPQPQEQIWNEIAELYNSQQPQQLTTPGKPLNATQIEIRLTKLSEWTRAYLYPPVGSLNRNKSDEVGGGEVQDDLTDNTSESLLDNAIEREEIEQRSNQQSQLQTVLTEAMGNLSPELQEVLILFYRDGLSQQQLSDRLNTSQPTVSRRLKKAEAQLLAALLAWIESQLNKIPDPNELKSISTNLKEWLTSHFHQVSN